MNTSVAFIFADEMESSRKHSLSVNCYQAIRTAEEVQILCERATILCYTCIACLV
jgi:hypothetical protein